jgi:hypothetical protein
MSALDVHKIREADELRDRILKFWEQKYKEK